MYVLPFDRKELLRREIIRFIGCSSHAEYASELLSFKQLKKDQNRFPDASAIREYAVAAKRTEQYLARVATSLEKLTAYLHTPFSGQYKAEFNDLIAWENVSAMRMQSIMKALGIACTIDPPSLDAVQLYYQEIPDPSYQQDADAVLQRLADLLEKMRAFIRQGSVYGNVYTRYSPLKVYKPGMDYQSELKKYINLLDETLCNPYKVDILDDGSQELLEMLSVFWRSIHVLCCAPILRQEYRFSFGSEQDLSRDELDEKLAERLDARFHEIQELLCDASFLADADEAHLFSLYDQMLELDTEGYLRVSRGKGMQEGAAEKRLNTLIGLSGIKNEVRKIKAYFLANKQSADLNLHMCFYGNPGTGKTETARIIADILHENGLLPTNHLIETDRSGLVAGYVGQTALKTQEIIQEAMGGVLFIDEAYALVQDESGVDYGHEAVAALIKAMEDHRGKFCVILAGYRSPMEKMIASNPGFASRIQFYLQFPDYSRSELQQIAMLMLEKRNYTMSDEAMEKMLDITDVKRKDPDFANARELRIILDQITLAQSLRTVGTQDRELALTDVNTYIKDAKLVLPTAGASAKRLLTAEEELDAMVGLTAVKRMIRKIRAYAVRNHNDSELNLHMCFYGNPGTGKTEVARLLSRILYDAGVLPEARFVETDAHGLIGRYAGETAPKTHSRVEEAMGGILFIDEAYSLTQSDTHYGDEAIAVLLKEMEDKRGRFCVIFAGYKEEMQQMLQSNPGMESRISFTLDFPDYTQEELQLIAHGFLAKKGYGIEADALSLVLRICEYYRSEPNYANARTLRNVLEQVIMNQNLRTETTTGDCMIICSDVEDYLMDENINMQEPKRPAGRIGF